MASQIAASILVGISALRAAAALGSWYDHRKQNRTAYYATTADGTQIIATPVALTEHVDRIFLVLSTLGCRLLSLDAVKREFLPEVRDDAERAFARSSLALSSAFDLMDDVMQGTIACAVAFCAACHPMHIYRGFGCGVLNDPKWANPEAEDLIDTDLLLEMDATIAYYKSIPQDFRFFRKSPSRIGRVRPSYVKKSKAQRENYLKDIYSIYERRGFPQPKDPNLVINCWNIPFATWNGRAMYEHHGHSVEESIRWQLDPGRFLHAWTIGEQLDLQYGEAVIPLQEHIGQLAAWLENHRGMTFTVLYDRDLDDKHKFSYSTRRSLQASVGNPRGHSGKVAAIVLDPRKVDVESDSQPLAVKRGLSYDEKTDADERPPFPSRPSRSISISTTATPPPLYSASSCDSTSSSEYIKRRPVPTSPTMLPPCNLTEDTQKQDTLHELEFLILDDMV